MQPASEAVKTEEGQGSEKAEEGDVALPEQLPVETMQTDSLQNNAVVIDALEQGVVLDGAPLFEMGK